jgi:mono/diheme cytochrome c family protein
VSKSIFIKRLLILLSAAIALIIGAYYAPINEEAGDGILRFFGRFHVLVLHFPVTLLLLAPIISLATKIPRFQQLKPVVQPIWWLGALSAVVTVTMGLLLASNEGFAYTEVQQHMLAGISVALLALYCTGLVTFGSTTFLGKVHYAAASALLTVTLLIAAHEGGNLVHGNTYLTRYSPEPLRTWLSPEEKQLDMAQIDDAHYIETVRPLLSNYCFGCHGPDTQKANVRLDVLNPDFIKGPDAGHWHAALDMINTAEMPPKKKKQPSDAERRIIVDWMTQGIQLAKAAKRNESKQVLRRLTKEQYTNTLQELLGIEVNFGRDLPDDPLSELGFSNSGELLQSSTLHLETFEKIAREALDKVIVGSEKPKVHHYRMNFGHNIGKNEKNTLSAGYMDVAVAKENFLVEILNDQGKPTEDTDGIKKYFSASMRGSELSRFKLQDKGINLYSAKPHVEITESGKYGTWNGPSPNLAMQIKDQFPSTGDFVVRVKASEGNGFTKAIDSAKALTNNMPLATLNNEGVPQIDKTTQVQLDTSQITKQTGVEPSTQHTRVLAKKADANSVLIQSKLLLIGEPHNYYQIDLVHPEVAKNKTVELKIQIDKLPGFTVNLTHTGQAKVGEPVVSSIASAHLAKVWHKIVIKAKQDFPGYSDLVVTKLDKNHIVAKNHLGKDFSNQISEQAQAVLLPYLGTRTDDGMDYKNFAKGAKVSGQDKIYTFSGRLENLPVPPHGTEGDHITSSSLKVGVWNDDKIKQDSQQGSTIKVDYIEFEAPYFSQWPTAEHEQIFFPTEKQDEDYAKQVIQQFANKAFRRPISEEEITPYYDLWLDLRTEFPRFEDGVKEALVTILCSPRFLYLVEPQSTEQLAKAVSPSLLQKIGSALSIGEAHASENTSTSIDQFSLANRLSYFLWNSSPDQELLDLAKNGDLAENINQQMSRMLNSDKLAQFIEVFAGQWLRLDRQQGQTVNVKQYPDYTRFVKQDMRKETEQFLQYLIQQDKSVLNVIDSDFAMLNQNLAEFYGFENIIGPEFRPVEFTADNARGGLLAQGAFLTGHADGTHSHPVKRAVWVKSKILGDEPPPPPPNVPDLDPETPGFEKLTLKQQLELHRNKESCRDCHAKIDPYGVVFEHFDAVGRYRDTYKDLPIDASSILPSGTSINGMYEIKQYLLKEQSDKVTLSVIKHLFGYALGREIGFSDDEELDMILQQVKADDYRMQSLLLAIINSPSFNRI